MLEQNELQYHTKPFQHQIDALEAAWGKDAFAFFMEQGTGKSKIVVDETVNLIERGLINCVVILAPNGVHANWQQQFEIHGPPNYQKWFIQVYKAQPNGKARERQEEYTRQIINSGRVLVFLMNIESLSHEYGMNYLYRIMRARKATYLCIDESHKIKTPGSKRTKIAIKLGAYAKYRRIATGTEAEEGLHNLYAQFRFLDWNIIGFKFYTPFRNMFCQMGGYEGRQILGYQNQNLLAVKIAPYAFQIRKKDCLDLPDKLYTRHTIDMTSEQEKLYDSLEEELLTEIEEGIVIDTTQVLARMAKLQQVLCGHINYEDKTKELECNRASYVSELVESANKSVVFCKFVKDVELVRRQLAKDNIKSISISGETNNRLEYINSWRADAEIKALVMTTATGGTGLTLHEASTMIFYSNSFSSTERLQAEDRIHRIGQVEHCTYHDIVVKGKIDSYILKTLREKKNMADTFRNLTANEMKGKLHDEDE